MIKGRAWTFGDHINTDLIIPGRYLDDYSAKHLAAHVMEDADPEFPRKVAKGDILVAGRNFGCGSSREHAVWAVYDYGFRAVVSSFFADIFKNNALNNGLLPVVIPEKQLADLLELIKKNPGTIVRIDLREQLVTIPATGESSRFEINPFKKECLLKGLDDIEYLLGMQNLIRDYEIKTHADENRNN